MGSYFEKLDRFSESLARSMIRFRWIVLIVAIGFVMLAANGGQYLGFSNNYRAFFSEENPELTAFEELQATYTKNDNFVFVLEPKNGNAFTNEVLSAVQDLTESAWQIPHVLRVDSLSNYQYSYSEEDDLIVEDFVQDAKVLTPEELNNKKSIALSEPLLLNQLVDEQGRVTAVNVVLQYPEKDLTEVPEAAAKARQIQQEIKEAYPDIDVWLSGVSMLNNAFAEAGFNDITTLMPKMFLIILVIALVLLRSIIAVFITSLIIIMSSMVGMGVAGYAGVELTPIAASAPIVILTLAIADSIHIFISLREALREGLARNEAIVEAIRLNFLPVTITSLTTAIGFLALNFSDSPPFWHLGNITVVGVITAWILSVTLLPALVSLLPYGKKTASTHKATEPRKHLLDGLAKFVSHNPKSILVFLGGGSLVITAMIPLIEFNDQWSEYFDKTVDFRVQTDEAVKHFGMYPVEFSIPAKDSGGISEPEYLQKIEEFAIFLREQPAVKHVYSITDIIKRLNKNLHSDDPTYYKLPESRELAAQYLLMYEMSLPYRLDLNDRINIDKSATRITATLGNTTTLETKEFLNAAETWLKNNFPDYMKTTPTSAQVMFTYITDRNVAYMIKGTIISILAISFIMILALRSIKLGVLSLVPNGLPILASFGTWALIVGEVGFSVATAASVSMGIIVDDTVHFMTKYLRARQERSLDVHASIQYAFRSVGVAIIVNTVILVLGFLVMATSTFKGNEDLGLLTTISITYALILDFLLLPALLIVMDNFINRKPSVLKESYSNA